MYKTWIKTERQRNSKDIEQGKFLMSCSSWPVVPLAKPDFRESLTAESDEALRLFLNDLMVMECCKN